MIPRQAYEADPIADGAAWVPNSKLTTLARRLAKLPWCFLAAALSSALAVRGIYSLYCKACNNCLNMHGPLLEMKEMSIDIDSTERESVARRPRWAHVEIASKAKLVLIRYVCHTSVRLPAIRPSRLRRQSGCSP